MASYPDIDAGVPLEFPLGEAFMAPWGDTGLLYLSRKYDFDRPTTSVQVFGKGWVYLRGTSETAGAHVVVDGRQVAVAPGAEVFAPSFSVVEWRFSPGPLACEMIISQTLPPASAPRQVVVVREGLGRLPHTEGELAAVLAAARDLEPIGKGRDASDVVLRAKARIDARYTEPLCLADIAKDLGIAHTLLTRYFKRTYGLPPIQYLNQLRILDSLPMLHEGRKPVADIALSVGFGEVCQYYTHFKKILAVPPARLRRGSQPSSTLS